MGIQASDGGVYDQDKVRPVNTEYGRVKEAKCERCDQWFRFELVATKNTTTRCDNCGKQYKVIG